MQNVVFMIIYVPTYSVCPCWELQGSFLPNIYLRPLIAHLIQICSDLDVIIFDFSFCSTKMNAFICSFTWSDVYVTYVHMLTCLMDVVVVDDTCRQYVHWKTITVKVFHGIYLPLRPVGFQRPNVGFFLLVWTPNKTSQSCKKIWRDVICAASSNMDLYFVTNSAAIHAKMYSSRNYSACGNESVVTVVFIR